MCLTVISKKLIAKKDIIVYKVVIKTYIGYITSVRQSLIILNKVYKSDLIVTKSTTNSKFIIIGIHSFTNKKDAKQYAKHFKEIVIKCIIPKGSIYYRGTFDIHINDSSLKKVNSIASDTIQYTDEIVYSFQFKIQSKIQLHNNNY